MYLNLPYLKARRVRGDMIETYKIQSNYIDIDANSVLSLNTFEKTRNSNNKLLMKHCNTLLRKFYFSNRVTKHWNALPNHIKSAPNLLAFKSLLDSHHKAKHIYQDFDE